MRDLIYFISASNQIKIGVSRNVDRRLRHIGTHLLDAPVLLGTCSGSLDIEREIHSRLKDYRLHGEWFKDCPEVREVIDEFLARPTRDWLFVSKPRTSDPWARRRLPEVGRLRERSISASVSEFGLCVLAIAERRGINPARLVTDALGCTPQAANRYIRGARRAPWREFAAALEHSSVPRAGQQALK